MKMLMAESSNIKMFRDYSFKESYPIMNITKLKRIED
jgi:hypothetical protein